MKVQITQAQLQLIAAVHPTMIVMVTWYLQNIGVLKSTSTEEVNLNNNATWNKIAKKTFPDWLYVYGIYYGKDEVVFHVHFPVIKEEPGRRQGQTLRSWVFLQVELGRYPIAEPGTIERPTGTITGEMPYKQASALRARFHLAIALATVRRHNEMLEQKLGSFANKFIPLKNSQNRPA